jgi:hypothetical protein
MFVPERPTAQILSFIKSFLKKNHINFAQQLHKLEGSKGKQSSLIPPESYF